MFLKLPLVTVVVYLITAQTTKATGQVESQSYSTPEEKQGILIRNLRSYEIDFPTITNEDRTHLGYLTDSSSRRRRKRAINLVDDEEHFHYKFKASGKEIHMKLRINKDLFGPDFTVEHFYGNGSKESVKMTEHCYLIGETLPHQYKVAVSDCDGLYGVVDTDGDMLYIEPLVNDSYVERALLNKTGRPHLVYRHSHLPKHNLGGFDGLDMMRIESANTRKTSRSSRRNVHYSFLNFINRSGRIIKLMWVDRRRKQTYFATLMPGTSRKVNTFTSHRWAAIDEQTGKQLWVGNRREYVPRRNKQTRRTNVYITLPRGLKLAPTSEKEIRSNIGKKYIESMVVADKSVVDFHGKESVSRYVLALMSVVSHVFKHKTLGFDINYVLVRIVLLHKDPEGVTLHKGKPNQSLLSACEFMYRIREGRNDDDPKFHDHATFLTRKEFGTAAGYAPVYGMCHPVRSCTLNQEDGFPSTFIIAHEVGHSLGMEHDGEGNKCSSVTSRGSIMAPLVQSRINRYMWSSCSRKELMASIRNFPCLNDKPGKKHEEDLPFLHRYPGVHYSTDEQCLFDFGKGYKFCTAFYRDPCEILWCNMPAPYRHLCKSMRAPALNGTVCGTKKWCIAGRCVRRTEEIKKPKAIHGNWSVWEKWEKCSQKCGFGIRTRKRSCDRPRPRHGGRNCVGSSTEQEACKIKDCQHTMPFHEIQLKKQCFDIGIIKDRYRVWSYYDETSVNLNCTFEHNFCAWVNLKRDDERDWTLNKGKTRTSKTGPSVDHTTNSTRGQYIYFETSSPARAKDRAAIASPDMGVRRGCLSFYYHMYGKEVGSLKVVRSNAAGRRVLWARHTNEGDRWLNAQVDINENKMYNLIIEAHRKESYLSDIALDDITFAVGPCNRKTTKITEDAVNPCTVSCVKNGSRKEIMMNNFVKNGIRCYDNSAMDICIEGECRNIGCDNILDSGKRFDRCGVCGGDGTSCKRNEGRIKKTPKEDMEIILNVPEGSSSLNIKKHFNTDHVLVLAVQNPSEPKRVKYIINGNDEESPPAIYYGGGTQYVYTREQNIEVIKSLGVIKQRAILIVKSKKKGTYSPMEIRYEFFDTKNATKTTVDKNEKVANVEKKDEVDESGSTKVKSQPTSQVKAFAPKVTPKVEEKSEEKPRWVILNQWTDCSRSCGKGVTFFRYFCKIGEKIKPRTFCKHLELNITEKFRFCNTQPCNATFKWTPKPWSACSKTCSLGVMSRQFSCIQQPGNKEVTASWCSGVRQIETKTCFLKICEPTWATGNWSECSTTCGLGSQTRDVFCGDQQEQRTTGCNKMKQPESRRNCRKPTCVNPPSDPLDCDFEKGLCEWKQMTNDQFDWQRNQGGTKSTDTGPNHDHTLKNRSGYYMFIEASDPQREGHKAKLISPEVNVRQACLTFYYHMWGRDCGSLKVKFLANGGFMDELTWEKSGDQGRRWIKAEVNIPIGLSYQVIIEASRGRGWRGDVAIDDITFHHMECEEKDKTNYASNIHSGKQIKQGDTAGKIKHRNN